MAPTRRHLCGVAAALVSVALLVPFPTPFGTGPPPASQPPALESHIPKDTDTLELSQGDLHLDHEVVQYVITFSAEGIVNVTVHAVLLQTQFIPTIYFVSLTDGTASVFPKTPMLFLSYIPSASVDVTTPRGRFALGRAKFALAARLHHPIGIERWLSGEHIVNQSTTWYLTLAVLTPTPGDLWIRFTSRNTTMRATAVTRHSNLALFCASDNDFGGSFYGAKIFLWGASKANVSLRLQATQGTVLHFGAVGHSCGGITVSGPQDISLELQGRQACLYTCLGNHTGEWALEAYGWSLRRKHEVFVFFIDIDPQGSISEARSPHTAWNNPTFSSV